MYIDLPRFCRANTDAILRATLYATFSLVMFTFLALADLRARLVGTFSVTFWMARRPAAPNFGIPVPNSVSDQTSFMRGSEVLTTAIGAVVGQSV